ncbi:hypothetical protein M422DRAFT_208310 [Sphaerobolus stellatus SS14]|uniref:Dolichol phosphate-mannose biosynthesis regulatory protein n=1 Tax=Sphaerobolus stellatus (strain SS14) TaxID=990650 RepID=A0A0C9ULX8_SPHS4|nr:hypothetical protein M422DRAFT_208310 [Sphaerobolus stellatus SS14]
MAVSDKALGGLMLVAAAIVFGYYTTWAILLPFFPASHPLHELFPAREWAVRIPAFLLLVGGGVVGLFVGTVYMKEKAKKKAKFAVKSA